MSRATVRLTQPMRGVHMVRLGELGTENRLSPDSAVAAAAARQVEDAARQALDEAIAALADGAQQLHQRQRELLEEMQQAAIELAVAIASRVTYEKSQSDRLAIEELARAVVGRLQGDGPVRIRMHPDDVALIQRRLGEQPLVAARQIEWVADASLDRATCLAESADLTISTRLEEQLQGIRRHLLRNLSNAQVERRKPLPGDRDLRRYPDRRETA